jgi:hypothetical protein
VVEVARNVESPRGTDYERSDASAKGVALTAVIGLVVLGVIVLGLFRLSQFFFRETAAPPAPPVARQEIVPPPPRLHAFPTQELQRLRAAQTEQLGSYGWVDRQKGLAHIPIDRAMELLAQHGWPGDPGGPTVGGPPAEPRQP